MTPVRLAPQSDVPVYRQIVLQLSTMIETGRLIDGERLPAARLLADNLGISRNTVAQAYTVLRDAGLVESRGRSGMVVVGAEEARSTSDVRSRARAVLVDAVQDCLDLGLSADDVRQLIGTLDVGEDGRDPSIVFVECNADRATYFADELGRAMDLTVTPVVLDDLVLDDPPDLLLTTFFHLAEVRQIAGRRTEVVAIVVAPHVQTLVQIAQVPKGRAVGIRYRTEEQAVSIRDSLTQAGIADIVVLHEDDDLESVDLVVVPSEAPDLVERLSGRVRVIEYGNTLDPGSIRMVADVVRDLRRSVPGRQ